MAPKLVTWNIAAGPYGSWPADECAAQKQAQGQPVRGVLDRRSDDFLVIADSPTQR